MCLKKMFQIVILVYFGPLIRSVHLRERRTLHRYSIADLFNLTFSECLKSAFCFGIREIFIFLFICAKLFSFLFFVLSRKNALCDTFAQNRNKQKNLNFPFEMFTFVV